MSAEKLRTEIRQEQIAEAALRVITSHGMKGLSVARVARQIGIVPSGIYRHYSSKDEILDAVLSLIEQRLLENVSAVCKETPDPLKRIHRLLMRHIKLIRENRAIPRVVFSEDVYGGSSSRKSKIYGIITNYLSRVAEIVSEGQKEGKLRSDVATDTVAVMFLGLIQPGAILWHLSDGEFDVTKQAEKAWRIFQTIIEK
jgi:AcrR family transcriptional regulator